MMAGAMTLPDEAQIRADLEFMTARWHEIDAPCMMEIRAFKEGAQPQIGKFAPDWMDEAVDWITSMNETGFNCYAVRNPIKAEVTGSAKDDDIVASFFLWADCDDSTAAENVLRFHGPKWRASVITGTIPSKRAHVYWELDTPCTDMAEWRNLQENLASYFQSDSTVVNPSRIMRIGGTVSYPAKQKMERGYQREICELRTSYDDPRGPVSFEQMRRVFGDAKPAAGMFAVNTATGDTKTAQEYADILKRAQTDGQKHAGVRDLCASLAGQGVSPDMAEAIVRQACPVWDDNVEALLATAYQKFYKPQEVAPEPVTPQTITDFKIDSSADFLSDLKPLEYLIDGLLPTGVVYSLTGHAGHGKTTLALQFALAVSKGEQFGERDTSKGSVLILAGENPYNVKWQYAAALAARGLKPQDADVHFIQGRFSIDQWSDVVRAKMDAMPDLKLVIVDSLQAFFEGDNDNDNSQMVTMAHKLRKMGDTHQRPAILIIAHPAGKTPAKDNLVPRGGGAFLNEIDGNLTVWSDDASQQTLHHSQKFRGAGFDPMEWIMQVHEFDHLTDIHGTPLKLPVSRPEMTIERANREVQSDNLLRQYLEAVEGGKVMSEREAAQQLNTSRWKVRRIIETAKSEKLIKRYAKTYKITDGGRTFLEAQNSGY